VKKIITNHSDSYQLYSTEHESVIATFQTEQDLKRYIAEDIIYAGKLLAIKSLMTYPRGWTINEKVLSVMDGLELLENYITWAKETILDKDLSFEEYKKRIDTKLAELL